MRKAIKDRAGYVGYRCERERFLDSLSELHKLVADIDIDRGKAGSDAKYFEPNARYGSLFTTDGSRLVPIDGYTVGLRAYEWNWLDNFLNIPTSFSPSTTTLQLIAGNEGYFDIGGTDLDEKVSVSRSLLQATANNPITYEATEQNAGSDRVLYPGYIAPTDLSTAYKTLPIQVDVASNKYEDGNLTAQVQQERRNIQVDEQLDKIFISTVDNVMIRMLECLNSVSECSNFKIGVSSGRIVHQATSAAPTFSIGGGRVYVRDVPVEVNGTSATGEFDLAVRVVLYNPSGDPFNYYRSWTVSLLVEPSGTVVDSVSMANSQTVVKKKIGGVRRLSFEFAGVQYYTYKIERTPCYVSIPPYYVAKDGILYAAVGGSTHYSLSLYDCPLLQFQQ